MEYLTCHPDDTILQALKCIQKNAKRTVFVVDENNTLIGLLTDGDIRQALLGGMDLSQPVQNVMKKNFVFAYQDDPERSILEKFTKKIKIIPLVSHEMKLVDYQQFDKDIRLQVASPELGGNEFKYLTDAFFSTWISSRGEYIDTFEKEFAKFCGTSHAVAVTNGTAALHLALTALGIQEGDEVIVPDLTFAATINAVLYIKARPVIVDVEQEYWTIDPEQIKNAITSRTKAIIPVHIYGQPCNMEAVMRIARAHNLAVVEDAAEAHGAKYGDAVVGSIGDTGCFSFYGNKLITTGEGGMVVTNSQSLYEKMRILRDHGMNPEKRYWHDHIGFNYRMTNLQAAIGCAQLEKITSILEDRKNLENKYRAQLADAPHLEFQKDDPKKIRQRVTWMVNVLLKSAVRDACLQSLSAHNIDARPLFYSLGTMPLYKKYLHSNTVSLSISTRGLSLPTQSSVREEDITKIKSILEKL